MKPAPSSPPPRQAPSGGTDNSAARARHVTWVGFWVNAILAVLKIAAGVMGRSGAMIADGIHSMSDFVTDLIVIVMVGIARRKPDARYQYGHGKYETLATLIISVMLGLAGLAIFYDGLMGVIDTLGGTLLPRPGMIALVMALVSIAAKEWLFHYTKRVGDSISSAAVVANAWHHRSDALSSVATLAGVAGAMFLGEHWRVLDPLAAMLVAVLIVIVAVKLAGPSVKELLDVALPPDMTARMADIIASTPGVKAFHRFRSRRNGNSLIVDVHIKVDPSITVVAGHNIATSVENRLRHDFGNDMITNIHVEPFKPAAV